MPLYRWKGEDHPMCRLKVEDIREIRRTYKPYSRQFGGKALARKYGVGQDWIHKIANHRVWRHLA